MTHIRKLVSAACLVSLLINYSVSNAQNLATGQLDPTQVYSTPNIVQPTNAGSGTTPWVNGVYQDSLTCWAWGDPGYCGPNAIVRPGGNINFSFGLTNLYQIQSITNVLPNTGTGLRVNGYNFGFTAKNGNGWDDGRLDYLTAYVSFYDPKGSTVYNKNYDLNYQFNWTTFNFSENFITPYASKDLGSVQYGFVGRDNNFWAGPYGPEIYGVNFSLKYSVDPCFVNVLSSPSCPGYFDALAKLNTPTTNTLATVESTPTTITTITNDPVQPITTTYSAPTQTTTASSPTQTSTPTTTPSTVASITPTPTSSDRQVSGPSLSTVLGIVRNEQSRISAVESAAVSQANETASSLSSQAQQQAQAVAATAASSSQTQSSSSASSGTGITASSGATGLTPTGPSSTSVVNISALRGPNTSTESNLNLMGMSELTNNSSISFSLFDMRKQEERKITEIELPKNEGIQMTGVSPVKDYIDDKPKIEQNYTEQKQRPTEVKKNVQDNDAANGVTIAAIAKQPTGYDLYTSMALRDVAFYAPKEIYRNQRVVDNARLLRGLSGGSDRLHQQMIEQQYNLGK